MLGKVNVLHAQAHAFHEAQARAVEQFGHELMRPGHQVEDAAGFFFGQDGGEAVRFFSPHRIDGSVQFLVQHLAVEEFQGAQGLVLR